MHGSYQLFGPDGFVGGSAVGGLPGKPSIVMTTGGNTVFTSGPTFSAHLKRPSAWQHRAGAIGQWYGPTGPVRPGDRRPRRCTRAATFSVAAVLAITRDGCCVLTPHPMRSATRTPQRAAGLFSLWSRRSWRATQDAPVPASGSGQPEWASLCSGPGVDVAEGVPGSLDMPAPPSDAALRGGALRVGARRVRTGPHTARMIT